MKAQIKEVIERVQSETPTHFKRIRKAGYVLMAVGGVVKIVGIFFPPLLPVALVSFAGDVLGWGAVMAGVATTAKK
jgi:hypothetical protein